MTAWYVVQVAGGKEEFTRRLVDRLVCPDVLDECFTPRYEVQKKIRGTWKTCYATLFPGYVIAATPDVWGLRSQLHAVPEFTRVLPAGKSFVPLSRTERALIEALTSKKARTVEMSTGVVEGDRVKVASGPLRGREAWIASVDRRRGLAYLKVEMFGRTLTTKVGLNIVARHPAQPSRLCDPCTALVGLA